MPNLGIYLWDKLPESFSDDERIVRHIYSPENINVKSNTLKVNFLKFRFNDETDKNELSCNRFDFDSIDHLRALGETYAKQRSGKYYGLACTKVVYINSEHGYTLKFTPFIDGEINNHSHCDIYDEGNPPFRKGEPLPASVSLQIEGFLKKWNAHLDSDNSLTQDSISAP